MGRYLTIAKINGKLNSPATPEEMQRLKAHIQTAIQARRDLMQLQPEIPPLTDQALLGIALGQWLGHDASTVVDALGGGPR